MKENNFELEPRQPDETPDHLFWRNYTEIKHAPQGGQKIGIFELTQLDESIIKFFEDENTPTDLTDKFLSHTLNQEEYQTLTKIYLNYVQSKKAA